MISYANEVKAGTLGVKEETLRQYGAVSGQCAAEMLNGVCEKLGSDCGISVTGVAGPGGGTLEKPVGLVYIGVRYLERVQIIENHFRGSREQIRARTAAVALNTLRRFILGALICSKKPDCLLLLRGGLWRIVCARKTG